MLGLQKFHWFVKAVLFDLPVGDVFTRPDKAMAIKACENAELNEPKSGCVGGGTGATVGKILGAERCMKSGLGIACVKIGELKVGAVVVLNALAMFFDTNGNRIAGLFNEIN